MARHHNGRFLIGLVLFFLHPQTNTVDPEFLRVSEAALTSERHSIRWYFKSPVRKRRGVALVIHGLNLRPEKMEGIIAQLNKVGIDALNVSLHGHGDNYVHQEGRDPREARLDSFRAVSYRLWSAEVRRAYRKVAERARRAAVPIFLVGYSLGGLLGCDLAASDAGVHFDRIVLFAPALHIVNEQYILKALVPFSNMVIDSLSPENYRSNDGTPLAGYKALFDALDHFQGRVHSGLNVPTLVFIDREDEFISVDKLQDMIDGDHLDQWKIVTVRKDAREAGMYGNHLLIDAAVMGKQVWAGMSERMVRHLIPPRNVHR